MDKLRELTRRGWSIKGQMYQRSHYPQIKYKDFEVVKVGNYYFEAKHKNYETIIVNGPTIQTCIDEIYDIVASQKMDIDK